MFTRSNSINSNTQCYKARLFRTDQSIVPAPGIQSRIQHARACHWIEVCMAYLSRHFGYLHATMLLPMHKLYIYKSYNYAKIISSWNQTEVFCSYPQICQCIRPVPIHTTLPLRTPFWTIEARDRIFYFQLGNEELLDFTFRSVYFPQSIKHNSSNVEKLFTNHLVRIYHYTNHHAFRTSFDAIITRSR